MELPLALFHVKRASPDGLQNACKDCHRARSRKNIAKLRSTREYQKRERTNKKEYMNTAQGRKLKRARDRKRRAAKFGLPHVAYDANKIYEREAGICHLCGIEVDRDTFHVEHLIPIQVDSALLEAYGILSHPGDVPWNVSVAHPSCNSSKGNRMTQGDVAKYFQYLMLYGG